MGSGRSGPPPKTKRKKKSNGERRGEWTSPSKLENVKVLPLRLGFNVGQENNSICFQSNSICFQSASICFHSGFNHLDLLQSVFNLFSMGVNLVSIVLICFNLFSFVLICFNLPQSVFNCFNLLQSVFQLFQSASICFLSVLNFFNLFLIGFQFIFYLFSICFQVF